MVPLHKDNREDVCPICLDPLKEAVSTDCRHLFCRKCLSQHMDKASVSGVFGCPVCRKPCSEGVLGDSYMCYSHQKKMCVFCEASRHLLCVECLKSPEHQSHTELSIEIAISHYKERLNRRIRKLRKDLGDLQRLKAQEEEQLQALQVGWASHGLRTELQNQGQTKEQPEALPQHWPDQQEDLPVEVAVTQLSILVSGLERMAKELDASTLKDASDLLDSGYQEEIRKRVSPGSECSPRVMVYGHNHHPLTFTSPETDRQQEEEEVAVGGSGRDGPICPQGHGDDPAPKGGQRPDHQWLRRFVHS